MMKNVISQIVQGKNLEDILNKTLARIYSEGPVHITDMEILSYFAIYRKEFIEEHINKLLLYMGMYYKVGDVKPQTLKELVQTTYRDVIQADLGEYYTPVQVNIIDGIKSNKCFSFSAPTSTGKSHVFRKLILGSDKDIVIFVPSRALINEYYLTLCENISDKSINILTFVDKLNTLKAKRSIFILTPERASDLFSRSKEFDIEYFLFDEAQLSEEVSMRGLLFDSVVRRVSKFYPKAKMVFAQPFVANPEAQFRKNHIPNDVSLGIPYRQRNVGQIFYSHNKTENIFYHIGVDTKVMGTKFALMSDPIEITLMSGGTVLFYVSKSTIAKDKVFEDYKKYIDLCGEIDKDLIKEYQDRLKRYTGAKDDHNKFFYSASLDLLKKGVVVHHGSMPLKMRSIIEDFINAGLCKICFATSTIEQGINMPFDAVYITRFEKSKPLAIKNLIGRAGRSTSHKKLDVGKVIINSNNVTDFRKIIQNDYQIRAISLIENPVEELGSDFDDFRDSIINGTFVEEFNMPQKQLNILSEEELQNKILSTISILINKENALVDIYKLPDAERNSIFELLTEIYEKHLNRKVTEAENTILSHALHILFYRMYHKTFSSICQVRYKMLCNFKEIKRLRNLGYGYSKVKVKYLPAYADIPNLKLGKFPLVSENTMAKDVDFDIVVYDTYDFLDKLIGFKLSDIFYAAFKINFENTHDKRSLTFANLIKYGTSNEKEILMLRYGLSLDDISVLEPYILSIDTGGISVSPDYYDLPLDIRKPLERFV